MDTKPQTLELCRSCRELLSSMASILSICAKWFSATLQLPLEGELHDTGISEKANYLS